jgi:formylglycine-generating enzyme required for sulfatase activity
MIDHRKMTPTLDAYRSPGGGQLWVWCEHEHRWHYHGAVGPAPGDGDGDRYSHCACRCSPLRGGYALREVGPLTPAVRRAHHERARHRCPGDCGLAA